MMATDYLLAAFGDYFKLWIQIPAAILLIVVIVGWIMYRKRQT